MRFDVCSPIVRTFHSSSRNLDSGDLLGSETFSQLAIKNFEQPFGSSNVHLFILMYQASKYVYVLKYPNDMHNFPNFEWMSTSSVYCLCTSFANCKRELRSTKIKIFWEAKCTSLYDNYSTRSFKNALPNHNLYN